MIKSLISDIEKFAIDIYVNDINALNRQFDDILTEYDNLIRERFCGNLEVLDTHKELMERALMFRDCDDYLLKSAFLEAEIGIILTDMLLYEY